MFVNSTTIHASLPPVAGFAVLGLGDIAGDVLDGFTAWALNAIIGTTIAVVDQIMNLSSPSLRAGFFAGDGGPYATILGLSGGIVGIFFFLAIAQGVLHGTAGPIARRALLDAPIGILMILGTVTFTEVAVGIVDWISAAVMAGSVGRIDSLTGTLGLAVGSPNDASLLLAPSMLMMVGALLTALVLSVRSGVIFLIVAMSPILFATWLWPASRDIAVKTVKVLFGVILAKLVVTLGLVIGVGAITATIGLDSTGIAAPAAVAGPAELDEMGVPVGDGADPVAPVDTAPLLGTLLTGAAMFFLAAIAPLKLITILPGVEVSAAAVSGQAGRVTQAAMQGGYQVSMINRTLAQRTHTCAKRRQRCRPPDRPRPLQRRRRWRQWRGRWVRWGSGADEWGRFGSEASGRERLERPSTLLRPREAELFFQNQGNFVGRRFCTTGTGCPPGFRFVDAWDDAAGLAIEVKTGRQRASRFIRQQIIKDAKLRQTEQLELLEWHF